MPELDRYDVRDIDDAESGGSFGAAQDARLAAERAMERRDEREGRVTGRRARLPGALEGAGTGLCLHASSLLHGHQAGIYGTEHILHLDRAPAAQRARAAAPVG